MHRLVPILMAPMALIACATTPAPASTDGTCNAAKAQFAIGQPFTVELGARIQDASGARNMRAIRPGQAVTMDYRQDRVNVEIGADDKVVRVACG